MACDQLFGPRRNDVIRSLLFVAALAVFAPSRALAEEAALPAPSSSAQRLYESAKVDLLQVRSLLRNGRTQASIGSGFLIDNSDLVVTNYHVVSQIVLEPETYVGEYVDTAGGRGPVELLAVDVLHDLAVVRVNRKGNGVFQVPAALPDLHQGQYLYSMGNPLDLGFAISEGAYNGVISRSFYDQLLFTGPINAGMSGGPSVTADGRVAGVNVSKRRDGELVSFLVPVRYVRELLDKVAAQAKPPTDFKPDVGRQLLQHQVTAIGHLGETPLMFKSLGGYRIPTWESEQMRCWGWSNAKMAKPYAIDQVECAMESGVYVSDQVRTGNVSIRHRLLRSEKLGPMQFSVLATNSFGNQIFGNHKSLDQTAPQCVESFVNNGALPLRAVLCVRAYRKFPGLYDFTLLSASVDAAQTSLQSHIDIVGASYENGLRMARLLLDAISREEKR